MSSYDFDISFGPILQLNAVNRFAILFASGICAGSILITGIMALTYST